MGEGPADGHYGTSSCLPLVDVHGEEGVIESQVTWDQLCWREGAFLLVHGELELRVTLTPWEVAIALQPQWASPTPYMVFYFGTTLFHT